MQMIWNFKKKGKIIQDIHKFSGDVADSVIKYSMKKLTSDNVTSIFIAFQNFCDKMKDENFEYINSGNLCKYIGGEVDCNNIK